MRKRKFTIGWGPKEEGRSSVARAFEHYGKNDNPATMIITRHAADDPGSYGFDSAISFQRDQNLSFPFQIGEMLGFLASFLTLLETAEEEFFGIIFVNHLPRVSAQYEWLKNSPHQPAPTPTRGMEEMTTLAQGVERFCRFVSESLKTGNDGFESRACDWVYLNCEAAVDE